VTPPFDDVHVVEYAVMGAPSFAPGEKFTLNVPDATRTGWAPVGAAGAPTMTAFDHVESVPAPLEFWARSLKV